MIFKTLIVIIILILWFSYNDKNTMKTYQNLFDPLDLDNFRSECGNTVLRIEKYFTEHGEPTLYSTSRGKCTLDHWFNNVDRTKGYLSKLIFDESTDNNIGKYINKWIATNFDKFPKSLQDRITSNEIREHAIRITNGKWKYPNHFDATDNYLFILSGTRKCIIDNKYPHTITAGDMMYIPHGVYHEFWCDGTSNDLNIMINIDFIGGDKKIEENFKKAYPEQVTRIYSGIDYT